MLFHTGQKGPFTFLISRRTVRNIQAHSTFKQRKVTNKHTALNSRQIVRSGLEFRLELQRAVSVNKRRFVDATAGGGAGGGGLDLDLTYICDRLIGMGIPCVEGQVFRNDIREVQINSRSTCRDSNI